jgi:hypothetical protein
VFFGVLQRIRNVGHFYTSTLELTPSVS